MDLIWLAVIPVTISVILSLLFAIGAKRRREFELLARYYNKEIEEEKLHTLRATFEETEQRLLALEQGKAAEVIGKEVLDKLSERLSKVEETVEPLKDRTQFTSAEFHILLHEIERVRQDLDSRQAAFERRNSEAFSSFTSRMSFWMVVMSVLFTVAIGLLIYFMTRGS